MTTDKNRDGEKQAVVTGLMGFDGWCKAYPERLAVLDKNDHTHLRGGKEKRPQNK